MPDSPADQIHKLAKINSETVLAGSLAKSVELQSVNSIELERQKAFKSIEEAEELDPFYWDPKVIPSEKEPVPVIGQLVHSDPYKKVIVDRQQTLYKDEPICDLKIDPNFNKKIDEATLIRMLH